MSEFLRRQVVTGDPRQILRPEQLRVGGELAVVHYEPPLSMVRRFALGAAMVGIKALLQRPIPEQRAAFKQGWRTEADGGVDYSLWRGRLEAVGDAAAVVLLTHGHLGDWDASYAEPADIPAITSDLTPAMKLTAPFHEMGLAPITHGEDGAGRWLPHIAIAL